MQVAPWRRFGVGIAVICVHGLLFSLLRPGLQQHAMPLPPREIMISLLPSTPARDVLPAPQPALTKSQKPEKIKTPTPIVNKVVSKTIAQPAPKAMPVIATTPSMMPSHPVAVSTSTSASEIAASTPAQPSHATQAVASPAPTPTTSPAQPKTISSGVEYLQKPAPIYPSFSRRMQEEGKVILRVLVNLKGKPEQVEIQKSSGFPRLDEAARQTVLSAYLFKPYSENGQAQSVFVLIPINFQLNN